MPPSAVYPRPDFDRSHTWLSLNGQWDFAPDPDDAGLQANWHLPGAARWPLRIRVPFPWEAPASGVGQQWLPVGWYRRVIQHPEAWEGLRTILNIGAAYYRCSVWVNGRLMGEHTGGYLPFQIDVTDALERGQGELILRVEAPVDKRFNPHGKQRSRPPDDFDDCAFTPSSGLWQSVWLEGRPATYIERLCLRPTEGLDGITATATIGGPQENGARLTLSIEGQAAVSIKTQDAAEITLPVTDPQLWSPRHPYLYTVAARLESADGIDVVKTYTGLRKVEVRGDRLYLNGERLYIRGALDQGFWPETIYAAPDDDALRKDVELALAAGYNLVRKHLKLEDPRWLYWADRLGLLVWAEPPCVGRFTPESIAAFEAQLEPMVARDGNHPCIVIWGLYNEEWGLDWRVAEDPERQQAVERAYDRLAACDRTRPIVDNSGWWHVKTDVVDWHYYDTDMRTWAEVTRALSRDRQAWFGHRLSTSRWYETQLSVPGRDHHGAPLLNGEYGGGDANNQGWLFRWQTLDLRRHAGFSGYIYTELYDVEYEQAGLYTAARTPKDLGCEPAAINAETVLIFDLTPARPGLDCLVENETLSFGVRISHHGYGSIKAMMSWGWDENAAPLGSAPVQATPFEVTSPIQVRVSWPDGQTRARLHVWLRDGDGWRLAYGFLDVGTANAP